MPHADESQAIAVDHLVKRFPRARHNAVDDVTFAVRRGEIFGLLGPNGAGKTTTIGILTTTRPTRGQATIAGIDVVANPIGAKQEFAVVPQRNNLDRGLRVEEVLTFHAAYHGVPYVERRKRAETLIQQFGLSDHRTSKLDWLSGGLEQRVMLARGLMHDPGVLFLDEPTNNLDPQTRLFLWERIRALHEQGTTIVLTTHDMEEADQLCQRIAIMDHGRLLALYSTEGLKRLVPGGTMLEVRLRVPHLALAGYTEHLAADARDDHNARFLRTLENLAGVTNVERLDAPTAQQEPHDTLGFRIYANGDSETLLANAAQAVIQAQGELLDLRFAQPSLEDVFIYLTVRTLRS